jgi:peptide/nickel transport system substrate-binding protein
MNRSHKPKPDIDSQANTRPISGGTDQNNREWQLAEFVDAVAAEIDRAEDTLSLKSYARGVTFALKQLNLELEVKVRRDVTGRILFRTTNPDETSATVLKLDLAQMLQSQLHAIRKPYDEQGGRELATLPGITAEEIASLNGIAIYSVDDLERYTQTAAMIAEVSRKSNVADAKIRRWRGLPYIAELKPPAGAPGSRVLLEGGNFGPAADPNASILFQGQPVQVLSWSDGRITIQMPATTRGSGALFAVINAQTTNTISWEAAAVDLIVRAITTTPQQLFANEPVTFQAVLVNQGSSASDESFEVQWLVDDKAEAAQPHRVLQPGQASQESSTRFTTSLPAGQHQIRFVADPDGVHPDVNRANGSFVLPVTVETRRELRLSDFRLVDLGEFNPLQAKLDVPDVMGLSFRGLLGFQTGGGLEPNLASSWRIDSQRPDGNLGVVFDLARPELRFHDGTLLSADDVAHTYERLRESQVWGALMKEFVREVQPEKTRVSFVLNGRLFPKRLYPLFTVGIASRGGDGSALGCGPFKLVKADGPTLLLDSFDGHYLGKPRLHRIHLSALPADAAVDALISGKLDAATLPFSELLQKQLAAQRTLAVTALPAESPKLLIAQSTRLRERVPNLFDGSLNAHVWYMAEVERQATQPRKQKSRTRRA